MANEFTREWRCPSCHRHQTDHQPIPLKDLASSTIQRCFHCGATIEITLEGRIPCWARKSVTPLPGVYAPPSPVITEPPVQRTGDFDGQRT